MMDWKITEHRVELVAQAIHGAQQQACSWDTEPTISREYFRQCARNAITLLDEDIGVLLLALREAMAEGQVGTSRAVV